MKVLLLAILVLLPSSAHAYVGPGLIVMGNILGPFLIFIPFILLLLYLALRWSVKKMRRVRALKNQASEQHDDQGDKNPEQ